MPSADEDHAPTADEDRSPPPPTKDLTYDRSHRHRLRRPHARRQLQRRAQRSAGARSRPRRRPRRGRAGRRRARRSRRGDPRPDPHRRPRPEPGPPGERQCRHPRRDAGLGAQPAVWLGAARRRARLPADPRGLGEDRHRRRAGVDEPGAALCALADRRQDGRRHLRRHHAPRRSHRRLQRLPHGQHGPRTSPSSGRSPATRRTASPPPARTRPRPRRRRAGSSKRSSPSPSRAARATRWSRRTSTSATTPPRSRLGICAPSSNRAAP